MNLYSMLYGLTNMDFSVIGTLAGTAAKSALVSGMMYPITEVAYGATNKLTDSIIPKGIKQPLPNGYKPQELKNDPTIYRPTVNEERVNQFNKIANYLDNIKSESELKSAISYIDPKYSFELHEYLTSRGENPDNYMKKPGDRSSVDMATKKTESGSDTLKKALPWAAAAFMATNLMSPPTTDPQLQYQNNQKAIRNALFAGVGAYANKMGYLDDFKKSFGWKPKEEEKSNVRSGSKTTEGKYGKRLEDIAKRLENIEKNTGGINNNFTDNGSTNTKVNIPTPDSQDTTVTSEIENQSTSTIGKDKSKNATSA